MVLAWRNRLKLLAAYMEALGNRALMVLAAPTGHPCKLSSAPLPNLDTIAAFWFAKPHHAELVALRAQDDLAAIGAARPEGWIDMQAQELRDTIINLAAHVGASWQTAEQAQAQASIAIDEIIARVEASRTNGGLAQINAQYKVYRQKQLAKGEKAIPYSAHLAAFTRNLVVLAAQAAT